jgi:hypothetical protein
MEIFAPITGGRSSAFAYRLLLTGQDDGNAGS